MINLFAYRATNPKDLKAVGYPIGPDNDTHIEWVAHQAGNNGVLICARGTNAAKLQRPGDVLAMLRRWAIPPHALRISSGGVPAHPLMLPHSCQLQVMA